LPIYHASEDCGRASAEFSITLHLVVLSDIPLAFCSQEISKAHGAR